MSADEFVIHIQLLWEKATRIREWRVLRSATRWEQVNLVLEIRFGLMKHHWGQESIKGYRDGGLFVGYRKRSSPTGEPVLWESQCHNLTQAKSILGQAWFDTMDKRLPARDYELLRSHDRIQPRDIIVVSRVPWITKCNIYEYVAGQNLQRHPLIEDDYVNRVIRAPSARVTDSAPIYDRRPTGMTTKRKFTQHSRATTATTESSEPTEKRVRRMPPGLMMSELIEVQGDESFLTEMAIYMGKNNKQYIKREDWIARCASTMDKTTIDST